MLYELIALGNLDLVCFAPTSKIEKKQTRALLHMKILFPCSLFSSPLYLFYIKILFLFLVFFSIVLIVFVDALSLFFVFVCIALVVFEDSLSLLFVFIMEIEGEISGNRMPECQNAIMP